MVVPAGAPVPPPWVGAPVFTVDEATLADPRSTVDRLHGAWVRREPVVVALAVDPARFREPASVVAEPWTLGPSFEPLLDRLHFLVWANNYDARGAAQGEPVWWWARKAQRLGATGGGPADVVLPDGQPAWVDGGPRGPLDVDRAVVHADSVELGRLAVVPPPVPPHADIAPDQLEAVSHGAGPARILAPAGSGKTRVLTERLRHLIVDRGFERDIVLAVAYNKKAQLEMEERTTAFRPRIQTLNALGLAVLARARGGRAPAVLEEREVRRLVEELVPRQRRRVNTDPLGPYLDALSLVRLGLRDPAVVEDERDDVPGLAEAFPRFRRALADRGAVDFDDQAYAAIETLLADGTFRRREQAACRHLLVDEFQDLTPAHVLLLRLLASPGLDVFGVGDDDQVIYGHAGADPCFLVDYDRWFPGAATHALEVNYRCSTGVVDAARHLLSYNHRRVGKVIRPGPAAAASGLAVRRHGPSEGAAALAEVVRRWLADGAADPASVAVLTRVNSLLLAPHVALAEAGVPVDSVLRPDVLERTGVRAALAYLRIAADPDNIDGADVVEVYRRPSRGFPQWFPKWLRGRQSFDRLLNIADRLDDEKVAAKVVTLVDDLRLVAGAATSGTTRDVLDVVKDKVGLGGAMGLLDSSRAGEGGGGSSHLDDLEALLQVADLHPDPRTFEPWLRAVFRREADPAGVTLSTIHRVKGREWDRVAVFGVTAGLLPHRLALDVEEERRVLHVAITRGRTLVTLLVDASRPSPFLAELDGTAAQPAVAAGPAVEGSARQPRAPGTLADLPPEAEAAEGALRAWRLERSRRDNVPAYVVLPDRYLRGIAVARPRTLTELRALPGIGPTKLELYGEEILALLTPPG
ncbi:MAG: ATP-dependent DNA helicase UvrD2 [Acidimicrobiia bacterium]